MLPELSLALLALAVTAYMILGGADFGAGFWDLFAGRGENGAKIRRLIQRSMSPVWEANHVWLIFALVVTWTAFPVAFGSIMSTLAIPMTLAAIGIIFRGAAFALRGVAATIEEDRVLGTTFSLSSILVPFFFGAAVGGIASGRVPVGNAAGDLITSWLNPTSIMLGLLAIAFGAYVAAVFLAADAKRKGLDDLVGLMRKRALGAAIVAGALAVLALPVINADAPDLFDGLTSGAGLLVMAGSVVFGTCGLLLVWKGEFGLARWVAAVAVAVTILGWFVAQEPYLLPGELTIDEAAAPDNVLAATLICVALGLLILVPSLWFLFRATLDGRLDKDGGPLGVPEPETGVAKNAGEGDER